MAQLHPLPLQLEGGKRLEKGVEPSLLYIQG